MSEYQYYEFLSIDCPLTLEQKAKVSSLSSRANVTSRSAVFSYNYGDFRGDIDMLMKDYFDAMMFIASYGVRRLIFRIPFSLIDMKKVEQYRIARDISIKQTRSLKYVILDIDYCDEEPGGWIEGEDLLDNLVGLREEIIKGDFRGLYLSWLKIASDKEHDLLEPYVSPGLRNLSRAQETLVDFLEIDKDLICAAAQKSGEIQKPLKLETMIEQLPVEEQQDFLIRLCRGESNLSAHFNKRLEEIARYAQPQPDQVDDMQRRTIGTLLEAAKIVREKRIENERRKAEIARQRELEELYLKKDQVWKKAEKLIDEKKIKAYGEAVVLLKNLRDLAEYKGELGEFKNHIARIRDTYSNCPSLLAQLREGGL
jgi:hypothetical protein